MTTQEFFDGLLDHVDLKVSDKERRLIETKQNELREKLREFLDLEDDFLTGSYRRNTIIKPRNPSEKFDVDVFVAFNKEDYENKDLAELRQTVIDALHNINSQYPELGISRINESQRRSVRVEFGNNFQIDVVPAIQIEKDVHYKIFDKRTLSAVKSNPKLHGELLTKANEHAKGKLVPLIKMLRAWKRQECPYVKSFHIELLAVEILGSSNFDSYSEGADIFFDKAREYAKSACLKDPANADVTIDDYLDDDGKRQDFINLINTEFQLSEEARKLESVGDEDGAVAKWQEIFYDEDEKTAAAIRSGNFYVGAGGVVVGNNDEQKYGRIESPRSYRV
ncbi:MAG: hypothetical protein PHW95_03225 [Patescibacteria group bacterium]|nr:hypothetical protein [Patescibacteria group bacterium]